MPYPCKLPRVQLDTWIAARAHKKKFDAVHLAEMLFGEHLMLTSYSLLQSHHALTVDKIAKCLLDVKKGVIRAKVEKGQIYIQPEWRIRCKHMPQEMQLMLADVNEDVTDVFKAYYDADKLAECIVRIVGPARAEGARCWLLWKCPT